MPPGIWPLHGQGLGSRWMCLARLWMKPCMPLRYLLLELQELGHFVFGGHRMCGTPSVSVLLITVGTGTWWSAGPIFLRVSPTRAACSPGWPHSGLCTLWPLRPLLLLCLQLLERFLFCCVCGFYFVCDSCYMPLLHALLLLHALSSSSCLSGLSLVLEHPRWWFSRPSCWAWSWMGASSGSACGGVLAHLHCSSSSRDNCRLTMVWSKRCWHWRSQSLTEVTGNGIGATDRTGTLPAALACLAWFRIPVGRVPSRNMIIPTVQS